MPMTTGNPLHVLGNEESIAPYIRVFADDGQLTVVTFGSSNCPEVPEIAGIDTSSRRITLAISTIGLRGPCTTDMAARTFHLDVNEDLTSYEVEVAWGNHLDPKA